jgi:hypothetical protein
MVRTGTAGIALTETVHIIRRNVGPVTRVTGRIIRTETTAHTTRPNADRAASLATVRPTIQTAAPTILRNAVPLECTTVLLLTAWAEIAAIHSRTTATVDIRGLTSAGAAVRSRRSVAQIAAQRSRAIPRRPHPAAAMAAVEAPRAAEADLRAVPVAAPRAVAEVAVRTAAVLLMDATRRKI